jgi:predicted ThiF/HesA family dinucleotide-utilizing enzyme
MPETAAVAIKAAKKDIVTYSGMDGEFVGEEVWVGEVDVAEGEVAELVGDVDAPDMVAVVVGWLDG